MKTLKIATISTAITLAIIIACAVIMPVCAEQKQNDLYLKLTVVVGYAHVTRDLWTVDCMDAEGKIWTFYGTEEDAQIGNIFHLIMRDLSTQHDEEDEVVGTFLEGYTEEIDNFFQ